MNISRSLLYLLLLYAVLDKGNNLSLTNGLIIAFVILLLNCYYGNRCCTSNNSASNGSLNNVFATLNGV